MERSELLEKLCNAHGPSGYEAEVREMLESILAPYVDSMSTDVLGNLIVWRRGEGENLPVLMLDAHMDEVGFVVSHVEKDGFLRFAPLGQFDERVLPAQRVQIKTRGGEKIIGVIGATPPHIQSSEGRRSPYPLETLFIDIGAKDAQEVASRGVRIGDSGVLYQPFTEIAQGIVTGKAFDDRVGCAILAEVLIQLAVETRLPFDVVGVFSTFEETGARGAMVAAFGVAPQVALVLEGTVAADVPGVPESRCPSVMGKGPAITLIDKYTHCHPELVAFLEDIAADELIPYQIKRPIFGGTDGARIHTSRAGVKTATVSVPCRYIHSPICVMSMQDYDAAVRLVHSFVRRAEKLFVK
jgi:endoglucanase